ncbi:MAG: prolyl oligopeptidase family serine peptidase, partial [Myxococcota bacterium]|nr:prolyl oligopeptidase family serine peptidase [Myxococcota bacterium]
LRESEYGYLDKDLEALKKLSPITYIDQLKDPLLLFHGANDPRVPAGESVQIAQLLEAKKIPVQMVLFADEGHGVRKRKNRAISLATTLQFFTKHLNP